MNITLKLIREVTLVLTAEEARWLRDAMQTPLHGENPANEPELNRLNRTTLYIELRDVLAREVK